MAETRFRNMWIFLRDRNNDNLGDISSDTKCTICTRILINAHSSTSCGCRYCLECVKTYLDVERRCCPGNMDDCQLELLDFDTNIIPDLPINYRISKLIMECRYSCGFLCELRNMEEHERACGRQPAICPYVNVGCTQTQLVSDRINEHLMRESGTHATLLMACIDRLQEETTTMRLARDNNEVRINESMERIEQKVRNLRNKNKLVREQNISLRAEMEQDKVEHVAGTEQRLAELRSRVETLARDIELLEEKCSQSEEKMCEVERQAQEEKEEKASGHGELAKRVREIGSNVEMQNEKEFVWHIDGWAAKSQSARESSCMDIFSDAFFTHENGYRMCLCVCPDGDGDCEGTHLSVYFCLMKGPFDSILSWPFKREVTLSLTDQRIGSEYVSYTVTNDDNVSWNKPTTDRNIGYGNPELVELAALSSTAGLIQDDSIFIRCVVKSVTNQ